MEGEIQEGRSVKPAIFLVSEESENNKGSCKNCQRMGPDEQIRQSPKPNLRCGLLPEAEGRHQEEKQQHARFFVVGQS